MCAWQVAASGLGFLKDGVQRDCELFGIVSADDVNDAFSKVCRIATQYHPELLQAAGRFPRPVINANEIEELAETHFSEDRVELHWIEK